MIQALTASHRTFAAIVVAVILGLATGAIGAPAKVQATTACPKKACNRSENRCEDTDIKYSCTGGGTTPCSSKKC